MRIRFAQVNLEHPIDLRVTFFCDFWVGLFQHWSPLRRARGDQRQTAYVSIPRYSRHTPEAFGRGRSRLPVAQEPRGSVCRKEKSPVNLASRAGIREFPAEMAPASKAEGSARGRAAAKAEAAANDATHGEANAKDAGQNDANLGLVSAQHRISRHPPTLAFFQARTPRRSFFAGVRRRTPSIAPERRSDRAHSTR
jgi:hypothetical protein